MVPLLDLWLPIVLSAVFVFIASSVIHMVLGYHKSDYKGLPGEDKIAAAMREAGEVPPGYYTLPYVTDFKELANKEVAEKFEKGPVAFVTVKPSGMPQIGPQLGTWFAFTLVVSFFIAYLTSRTVGPGGDYLTVFRVAGTAAFLAYAASEPTASIWKGQPWSNTFRHVFDGFIYALLTGGAFGWLWPS